MKKEKQTLLWEISRKNSDECSYVFGTMHARDVKAFRFEQTIFRKIASSDLVATEFDLDHAREQAGEDLMNLPEGTSLHSLLRPKTYKKLGNIFLKRTGLPIANFDQSQPLFIQNLLTAQLLGSEMPYSLDETIWQFAKSKGIATAGIETWEEQLRILTKIPLGEQTRQLSWMIHNFGRYRRQLLRTADWYQQANLRMLHRAARKSVKGMRRLLLYDRNKIMAERIATLASTKSAFCAIGAGHLAGKKGVLHLLKQKGFRVKPVKLER